MIFLMLKIVPYGHKQYLLLARDVTRQNRLDQMRRDFIANASHELRTPLAVLDAPASGRMAIAEAVTNIACAAIDSIGDIRLSANWMAAAGEPGQDGALFDTVAAVGMELCPELGIAIPVGKDSLSMKTVWDDRRMRAPVSLIVSAFAPVTDAARSLTPQIDLDAGDSRLFLVDLGNGKDRLGGSALAQSHGRFGRSVPDLDSAAQLKALFHLVQSLNRDGKLRAYHDRSDGGVIATLCEMAFAARCGLNLSIDREPAELNAFLFSEEPGAVIQVAGDDCSEVIARFEEAGLEAQAVLAELMALLPEKYRAARLFPVGRLDKALDEAGARDWTVVDMKRDWVTVFPPAD